MHEAAVNAVKLTDQLLLLLVRLVRFLPEDRTRKGSEVASVNIDLVLIEKIVSDLSSEHLLPVLELFFASRPLPLHRPDLGLQEGRTLDEDRIIVKYGRIIEIQIDPDALDDIFLLRMLLRIGKGKADKSRKDLILVFLLRDAVPLLEPDIILCPLPVEECIKHIGIA